MRFYTVTSKTAVTRVDLEPADLPRSVKHHVVKPKNWEQLLHQSQTHVVDYEFTAENQMVILTGIQICLTSIEPASPLKTYSVRQDGQLQRTILAPSAFCVKTFPYLFLESQNPSGEALYSLFNLNTGKTEESRDIQMAGMRILGSL